MFYDQPSIQFLIDRIGWADPIPPSSITVNEENKTSSSGRFYDEFNKMVTVENVFKTANNPEINNAGLNALLYRLRKDAVLDVLSLVFDNNEKANYTLNTNGNRVDTSAKDYSSIIQARNGLFDNAIGYSMACKSIELFLSSTRKNATERDNKFNWETLKGELEGIKNEYGKDITVGLYAIKSKAIGKIIKILWTDVGYPKLIGRQVW